MITKYFWVYEAIVVPGNFEEDQVIPLNQLMRFTSRKDAEDWIVERMKLPAYQHSAFGIREDQVPEQPLLFEMD